VSEYCPVSVVTRLGQQSGFETNAFERYTAFRPATIRSIKRGMNRCSMVSHR
jgi:hypothetical protein